jgi:hypothetical protein
MKELLKKLLAQHSLIKERDYYYLSLYCPVDPTNRENIETHIKSLVLKALRSHKELAKLTRLHENILTKIFGSFTAISNLNRGIGIYIKFNSVKQQKGRLDEILDNNFNIITFSRSPKKEVSIGQVYSLNQLIWLNNAYTDALVLNIDAKRCEIYEIDGRQINSLFTLENTLNSDNEEDKKHFIDEIIAYVTSSNILQIKYEFLIVFYSNLYSNLIEDKFNKNPPINKEYIPIFISKNINNPNELLSVAKTHIQELRRSSKNDRLEAAKDNYSYYCEGWKEVTKAINTRKVSTLFIKPTIKKSGYVDIQNLQLSTYPKNGTIQVNDIAPWAVISVSQNGGEIVTLRDERYKDSPEISAQLRYAINRQKQNKDSLIKHWVEKRNGVPAIVSGTDDLLRIKFSESEELEEISWERFFNLLSKNDLLFIYDNEDDSRFCTFVKK